MKIHACHNADVSFPSGDGMGVNLLQQHLAPEHFLRAAVDRSSTSLRAVFPATTPAALTTLATATWPGQHGLPGWDLRDQKAV